MPSSFFGLTIASSGLNAAQAQVNTTANNISNANTKGYSRQQVNLVASTALRAYTKYGTTSTGVTAESVTQVRDEYYDAKYWNNQTDLGFYEKKLYYMNQIEGYYSEVDNSGSGFSAIFAHMFNSLDQVKTNSGSTQTRNQFISDAQKLMDYFKTVSGNLQDLQSSINDEIKTTVDSINATAQKVALLNKQINIIELQGGHANELRDERALLIDDLAKIVPVTAKEVPVIDKNHPDMYTGATSYMLKINGQTLVDDYEFNTLMCVSREERYNQSDIEGLYDIKWKDGASFDPVAMGMDGELKAMFEVRDGNNEDNLQGYVSTVTNNTITIARTNITEINKMNMPNQGMITVNNTQFAYDAFECKTDENGEIESYTFILKTSIDNDVKDRLAGKAEIGDTVDFMGVPYYQNQMNTFLRSFCEAFNKEQTAGVDMYGEEMTSFFIGKNQTDNSEYQLTEDIKNAIIKIGEDLDADGNPVNTDCYYNLTALNCSVAKNTQLDPKKFSTRYKKDFESGIDDYDLVKNMLKLEKDVEIFRGGGADTFLQCIYADVTVDTQECAVFTDNFTSIQNEIKAQRDSISGVDEDEEALNLVKFQNAYNLSSKCINVMSEIYDRLILNTGV